MYVRGSLIPSPLLSPAVRVARRKLGKNYHVCVWTLLVLQMTIGLAVSLVCGV